MLSASAGGGESHAKHTHQQSYCAVCFDTVRQSGGDAPYCKTAIAACWALPKLPSGRWAAPLPLVPLLLFTSLLNCVTPPLSLSPCLPLSLLVSLAQCFIFFSSSCSTLCLPLSSPLSTGASSSLQAWISRRNNRKREDWRRGWRGRDGIIVCSVWVVFFSPLLPFCLFPVAFAYISLHILTLSPALYCLLLSSAKNKIPGSNGVYQHTLRHTLIQHTQTLKHTHTIHTLRVPPLSLPQAVASERSCLISVSVGNWGSTKGERMGLWGGVGGSPAMGSGCALTHRVIMLHTLIRLM